MPGSKEGGNHFYTEKEVGRAIDFLKDLDYPARHQEIWSNVFGDELPYTRNRWRTFQDHLLAKGVIGEGDRKHRRYKLPDTNNFDPTAAQQASPIERIGEFLAGLEGAYSLTQITEICQQETGLKVSKEELEIIIGVASQQGIINENLRLAEDTQE